MAPLPAVLALKDAGVHVSFADCGYVLTYVEVSVDKILTFGAILRVPYVDPNNSHIRLRRCFNDAGA